MSRRKWRWKLTTPLESSEDYYGRDANYEYMSASQLKSFIGTPGIHACEERSVAELAGRYVRPASDALVIGGYVDVMLTGTEDEQMEFRELHPEMISSRGPTKGQLKAQYKAVDDMVARAFQDRDNGGIFMRALQGEWQKVLTGEICGHKFKGRLDVLGDGYITDLKTVENVNIVVGVRPARSDIPGARVSEHGQATAVLHRRAFEADTVRHRFDTGAAGQAR